MFRPFEYNSLELIEQKNYIIAPEKITLDDIYYVFQSVKLIPEPQISYPQADSFKRVINLLEMLVEEDFSRDKVTHTFDVDPRQTNYYTSAVMYLGLVDKRRDGTLIIYFLNDEGRKIMNMPFKKKYLAIVERILRNPSFHKAFEFYLNNGHSPDKTTVVQIMKDFNVFDVNAESTFFRRATTVRTWLDWILSLQN